MQKARLLIAFCGQEPGLIRSDWQASEGKRPKACVGSSGLEAEVQIAQANFAVVLVFFLFILHPR